MKKTWEFSDESVKMAEAAHLLGFDVIEKYCIKFYTGHVKSTHVIMRNAKTSCDLNPEFFPELEDGDSLSILYIMHHKEINETYKRLGMIKTD